MKLILVLILIPVLAQAAAQSASSTASTAIVPSAMTDIRLLQKAMSTHIQLMAYEKEIYDNAEEGVFIDFQDAVKVLRSILVNIPVDLLGIVSNYGRPLGGILPNYKDLSCYAVSDRLSKEIAVTFKLSVDLQNEIGRRWRFISESQDHVKSCHECFRYPHHSCAEWMRSGFWHRRDCSHYQSPGYPDLPEDQRLWRNNIGIYLFYLACQPNRTSKCDTICKLRYRIHFASPDMPFIREKLAELRRAQASPASTASTASTANS